MQNDNKNNNLPQSGRRKGTGFTNIGKYLQASSGGSLGSAIKSGIQERAGQVQSGIGEARRKFEEEAQKGALGTEEDKKLKTDVLSRFGQQDFGGITEEEEKKFESFRAGEYKGPQKMDDSKLGELFGKARQTEELGRLTRSTGGREALLSRFASRPGQQYQKGQRRLDTMLLGQTGGAGLREARRASTGLSEQISEAGQQTAEQAKTYQSQAAQFGKDVMAGLKDITGAYDVEKGEFVGGITGDIQAAQQKESDIITNIQDFLAGRSETLTQEAADRLGVSEGENVYGFTDVSVPGYVEDINQLEVGGFINETQQAKLAALSKLYGEDVSANLEQLIKTGEDVEYMSPEDRAAKMSEISTEAKREYETTVAPIIAERDEASRRASVLSQARWSNDYGFKSRAMWDLGGISFHQIGGDLSSINGTLERLSAAWAEKSRVASYRADDAARQFLQSRQTVKIDPTEEV